MKHIALLVLIALTGCSKPGVTAMQVCQKLEAEGVAANCKEGKPAGLGAAAAEQAVFDLPSVQGKTGQVLRFEKAEFLESTEKAFGAMAALAGRHQYASKKALVFVQLNSEAPAEIGAKAKTVVDGL